MVRPRAPPLCLRRTNSRCRSPRQESVENFAALLKTARIGGRKTIDPGKLRGELTNRLGEAAAEAVLAGITTSGNDYERLTIPPASRRRMGVGRRLATTHGAPDFLTMLLGGEARPPVAPACPDISDYGIFPPCLPPTGGRSCLREQPQWSFAADRTARIPSPSDTGAMLLTSTFTNYPSLI